MSKVVLEFLDVDEKTPDGRATKLTFCAQIEVSEYQHNPAAIVHGLEAALNRCFFQALADKGVVEEKHVAQYIPRHRPPVQVWR